MFKKKKANTWLSGTTRLLTSGSPRRGSLASLWSCPESNDLQSRGEAQTLFPVSRHSVPQHHRCWALELRDSLAWWHYPAHCQVWGSNLGRQQRGITPSTYQTTTPDCDRQSHMPLAIYQSVCPVASPGRCIPKAVVIQNPRLSLAVTANHRAKDLSLFGHASCSVWTQKSLSQWQWVSH